MPGKKAYIAKNFMGAFAFDDDGKLIDKILFPARPEDIAERLVSKSAEESGLESKLKGYEIDRCPDNTGEQKLKQQSRDADSSRVQQSVKRQPRQSATQRRRQQQRQQQKQQVVKVRRYLDEYAPRLAPVVTPMRLAASVSR